MIRSLDAEKAFNKNTISCLKYWRDQEFKALTFTFKQLLENTKK